ncbi:MAG TPA: hypothetical protein DCS87_11660 [Rheinheimera sp.]|nr:hypothetical protein [Rheinheimera sp.]
MASSIESVIIQAIKPSLPLVADRITPVKRDPNGALPAIVYESGLEQRERYLSGKASEIASVNIQFSVFAKTYFVAKEQLALLSAAILNSRSFTMNGVSILATEVSGISEQTESDSDSLFSASLVATVKFK